MRSAAAILGPSGMRERAGANRIAAPSWVAEVIGGRGFIASGLYDTVFFLLAPVLALACVGALGFVAPSSSTHAGVPETAGAAIVLMLVLSQAHAVAVFFRSHGNRAIFVRHRFAFVAVPFLLFAGLMISDWVMVGALVLAPFWAVHHLGMQSFGLGRLYDARWGNAPGAGRSLDLALQAFLNLGPFLAGWSLLPHLQSLRLFERVGWDGPSAWLDAHRSIEGALGGLFLAAGPVILACYLQGYRRLVRQGYRPCPQKIVLFATTGFVSVVAWGFLESWKAVFVMNLFHSVQYFALVWWMERGNLARRSRLAGAPHGAAVLLLGFAAATLLPGAFLQAYGRDYAAMRWVTSLALVVSLMHYWYDGFVWSVSRREV